MPCPNLPTPPDIAHAVRYSVLGVGPRPRLAYSLGTETRIAIGRRGEHCDRLRADLVAAYGLVHAVEVRQGNDALAEWIVQGGNYRPYARAARMRDRAFLQKAIDPAAVEQAVLLSDRQVDRVWRLVPVYEGPEDAVIRDPGKWAQDDVRRELTVVDPGGEAPKPAPLPMAVPKTDGRGAACLFFGFALDYGGGRRWRQEDFTPPLRIALGGLLNRWEGFGASQRVDQWLAYGGDQFWWGRNNPMPARAALDRDVGPAFKPR